MAAEIVRRQVAVIVATGGTAAASSAAVVVCQGASACAALKSAHDSTLGADHAWTKDSAHVTSDALDALRRMEDAKLCGTESEKPKSSCECTLGHECCPKNASGAVPLTQVV
jgi:hypothetical protein